MTLKDSITCEIMENPRSRNVRLRFTRNGVLVVVVPLGFNTKRIPEILETKREWIRKRRWSLKNVASEFPEPAPARIDLLAFGEAWEVQFLQTGRIPGGQREDVEARRIVVEGAWLEEETLERLREWLVKRCREKLGFRLEKLSVQHGLPYGKMSVKIQKTRWGSCSAQKTISLNAKLAFLPADLVDYVLCHELCHTVHLNHSRAFWESLERILPGSRRMRESLKGCHTLVPEWLEVPKTPSKQPVVERLTFYLQ